MSQRNPLLVGVAWIIEGIVWLLNLVNTPVYFVVIGGTLIFFAGFWYANNCA